MKLFKTFSLTLFALCLSGAASAININRYVKVGGTGKGTKWEDACGSIQKAIADCKLAGSGTVHVAAGRYYERITIEDHAKDITILGGYPANGSESRDYNNKTIIDGKNHSYCVFVRHSENINFDGILFYNGRTGSMPLSEIGTTEHGGIGYNYATGSITNCGAYGCGGYGFYLGDLLYGPSHPVVIHDCVARNCEDGFYTNQHPITRCTAANNKRYGFFITTSGVVSNCSSYGNKKCGVYIQSGNLVCCKVYNNENKEGDGGGVFVEGNSVIYGCEIFNNTALRGGGIYSRYNQTFGVIACTIVNNMAQKEGAGICTMRTRHVLSGNILWNNKLSNGTASQFVLNSTTAEAGSTMINSAIQGGGELPETDALNGIIDVSSINDEPGKPSVKFTKVCNIVGASLNQNSVIAEQDFSLQEGSACLRTGSPLNKPIPGYRLPLGKEYFAYGINGMKSNPDISNCGAWQLVGTGNSVKADATNAKPTETTGSPSIQIVADPDIAASFQGGGSALFRWLTNNIKYPQEAVTKGIQGRVIVKFVVHKDGSVSKVQIIRSVDPLVDRPVLFAVKAMPTWIPAKKNGVAVDTEYTLPISVKL